MAPAEPLSVFVTTFNNAATLQRCLDSVAFAQEIVVLDSDSSDDTRVIAERAGARIFVEPFKGYGPQKQSALDKTTHRWVLLLDADEYLSEQAAAEVSEVLRAPTAAGYTLPRREWMFWQWQHPGSVHNQFLRLFDRTRGRMSNDPIHAAPKVDGAVGRLRSVFFHYGEPSVSIKLAKIGHYADGLAERYSRKRLLLLRALLYPPFGFVRHYLFKRQFLNGSAGLIHSLLMGVYGFLKYARAYEFRRTQR